MKVIYILAIVLLISIPTRSAAQETLTVAVKSDQITESLPLGSLTVEGLGKINFVARRDKHQLTIQAVGLEGKIVGRAETVAGIDETPLYVSTPKGLKKLVIRWGTQNN